MQKQSKSFSGMVSTLKDNMSQAAGILAQPIFDTLKQGLENVLPYVEKVISSLSENGLMGTIQRFAPGIEPFVQTAISIFTTMGETVGTLKDNMSQAAGILAQPIFDTLKQGLENVLPYVEKVISSLSENGLMGTIQRFAPGIEPFVQTAISIFTTMGETVGVIIQSMTNFWNEHSNWLIPLITFVWTFISTFIMNTITAIGNVVQSGLAIIDGIINFFQNLFQGNFQGCWESIKQIFSNALTFVWNWMQVQFAVNIPNIIKNFGKSAVSLFTNMWSSIKGFFSGGITACLNFVKNLLTGAKTNFNTLKTFGANTFQALWSVAKTMMSNLLKSVISNIKQVPTNVRNFMNDAVNILKGINLFEIGKNMIQGLVNGIKNMAGNVVGAIGSVVKSGIDAAKKKLGINSPSKVFTQFGKWTGEGLAIGIADEENRVNKASKGLANSVIGGYNSNLKGINSNVNNRHSNPVTNAGITLNIENFINNREQDIENLAEELAFYLQRKEAF